jgi:Phosphoinositide phospholipase C, Ca2+-dependent
MLRAVWPRTSVSVCLVALAATACSSCGGGNRSSAPPAATTTTTVPGYRLDSTLRLDQVQVLGSHNSYHGRPYPQVLAALRNANAGLALALDYAHAPLPRQFAIGVRQIELDVWSDPRGGKFARPSFPIQVGVRLPDNPVMRTPGYKVIHQADADTNSTCLTFVSCMRLVRTWSDAHPGHVPIDIHVEMKDDHVTETMFAALEREIRSVFARDRIVTPDDVRGNAPTLGQAVRAHGWPTLGAVRGKVYFTLDNESFREGYLSGHPSLRGRLLFTPSSPGQDDAAYAKLNDPIADAPRIKAALAAHMIVRTRADADTFAARANDTHMERAALTGGAQLVSTDYEQPDPTIGNGYVVRIPGGTPARCDPVTGPPDCKPTDVEDPTRLTVKSR